MSVARDRHLMHRCLELARRGEGRTSPNPMVGAVVARGDRVVAEAYHRRAGGPHAEVAALRLAGPAARGATLYANLEPCCHYGRTPPCVDAILEAGIRRVVAAHRDPFPLVSGRGFAALRRAGVRVETGLLKDEAERLNERYLVWITRGRPFVMVKAGMTADGRIATATGTSRWITSVRSRALAHALRAAHDALMVGAGTILADDPLLTARRGSGPTAALWPHQPLRVIMDGRLRVTSRMRLLRAARQGRGGGVLIYTRRSAPAVRAERLRRAGAEIVALPASRSRTGVDIRAALKDLASRGVTSVMIEGGSELTWSALEARVVDKVALFVAPVIVGGREAKGLAGGSGVRTPEGGFRLVEPRLTRVGEDLLVEAYVGGRR